jgi:hypothetical protein
VPQHGAKLAARVFGEPVEHVVELAVVHAGEHESSRRRLHAGLHGLVVVPGGREQEQTQVVEAEHLLERAGRLAVDDGQQPLERRCIGDAEERRELRQAEWAPGHAVSEAAKRVEHGASQLEKTACERTRLERSTPARWRSPEMPGTR